MIFRLAAGAVAEVVVPIMISYIYISLLYCQESGMRKKRKRNTFEA
jgi:hypothetical protein